MEPEEETKLKDFPKELQDILAKEMFKQARVTVVEQEVKDEKQKRRNLDRRRRNYMTDMQTEAALLGMEEEYETAERLAEREDALIRANINQERMMQQMREQDVVIERKKQLFYYYEMNRRRVTAGRDIFE